MITPRLEMILRHVKGKSCADIGTDHCYVPIKLAEAGVKVIATDIKPGPLKMAEKHTKKYGQNIELRLGGGLSPIEKEEVETIIIAGMGGEMIEKIIAADIEKARGSRLILQPMNSQYELRKFLAENGFNITCEDIAVEGFKVYNLMVASSGRANVYEKEIDLHLPKAVRNHPLFVQLLEKKKREFTGIYNGLNASSERNDSEIERMERLLSELEEIERDIKCE
ncbi:MAG: SAM-dependent methyltransferase [Clostridia bacterium]|nr:SAM-dependent methyltransferase [Clostridia bacterium]